MESDTYRELGAKKSKARWPETRGAAFLLPPWRRCANWAFPQGTSPRSSDLPLRNSTRTLDIRPLEAAGVEIVEENGGKGWREAEETRTRKTPSGKISSRLKSSQPRDIKPIKRDEDRVSATLFRENRLAPLVFGIAEINEIIVKNPAIFE